MNSAQGCDLAPFFWDLSKSEKLSEIMLLLPLYVSVFPIKKFRIYMKTFLRSNFGIFAFSLKRINSCFSSPKPAKPYYSGLEFRSFLNWATRKFLTSIIEWRKCDGTTGGWQLRWNKTLMEKASLRVYLVFYLKLVKSREVIVNFVSLF